MIIDMKQVVHSGRLSLLTGIPAKWLRREAEAGRLPCLKIGKLLLFNPAAVEAVLAERAAKGETHDEVR